MSPGYFLLFLCTFLLGAESQRRGRMTKGEACEVFCPRPIPYGPGGGIISEEILPPLIGGSERGSRAGPLGGPRSSPRGPLGGPRSSPRSSPRAARRGPHGGRIIEGPYPPTRPDEPIIDPYPPTGPGEPGPWGPDGHDDSVLIGGDPRRRRLDGRGPASSPRNPFEGWGAAANLGKGSRGRVKKRREY